MTLNSNTVQNAAQVCHICADTGVLQVFHDFLLVTIFSKCLPIRNGWHMTETETESEVEAYEYTDRKFSLLGEIKLKMFAFLAKQTSFASIQV